MIAKKNLTPSKRTAGLVFALALALVTLLVFLIVHRANAGAADGRTPRVLGEDATLGVLSRARTSMDTVPSAYVVYVRSSEEPDIGSSRLAATSPDGVSLYFFASSAGSDRFCAMAAADFTEGPTASVLCAPINAVGTGRVLVRLQTKQGGPDMPATYFGIVPDGVVAVIVDGKQQTVTDNSYSVSRPDGTGVGEVTFIYSSGKRLTVDTRNPQ